MGQSPNYPKGNFGTVPKFPKSQNKKGKKMKEQKFDDQVEGRNSVLELLESGKDINKIYVTRGEKHGSINKILAIAKQRKVIIVEKDKKQMDEMAQQENYQGVIAIVPPFEYVEIEDILNFAKERQEALQREQSALSQRFRQTLAAVPFFTQTEPSITLPACEMIVGTSVDDRQINLSESRPGDPLSVIHAPTAKYPNAAKIVNDRTEKILGTVNIDTEKTLLSKFGNGYSLHGSLKEVYSTPAGSTGTIEILSKTE